MKWESLLSVEDATVFRGALFRFPAKWPFEDVVDFMLFDTPSSDSGYGFLAASGYHGGRIEVLLPEEARYKTENPEGSDHAIDTKWLQRNWRKWIYDVSPRKVKVCIGGRPKPRMPG